VLLLCPSKDQDVVQIHHHNAFHYKVLEDIVHHSLESSRTVGYPKEHHQGFKHASISPEGHLLLVSGLNADIVETPIVKDMQSGSRVTQSRVELLWSGRELTTKWGNNLGLSSCAVPRSAIVYVVAYFKRTELLSGDQERSID